MVKEHEGKSHSIAHIIDEVFMSLSKFGSSASVFSGDFANSRDGENVSEAQQMPASPDESHNQHVPTS